MKFVSLFSLIWQIHDCVNCAAYQAAPIAERKRQLIKRGAYTCLRLRPCKNGGICTNENADYSCACSDGWSGKNCDIDTDNCANSPCKNGGICTDELADYSCVCPDRWSGKNCEIDTDKCASSPCKNGGICTNQFADYSCKCTDGWSGKNCEIDTDDCASSPCKNGGTCTDQLADYSCGCQDGWSGKNCEIDTDECASSPCKNGGTCTDQLAGYSCGCPDGLSGKNCEIGGQDHHGCRGPESWKKNHWCGSNAIYYGCISSGVQKNRCWKQCYKGYTSWCFIGKSFWPTMGYCKSSRKSNLDAGKYCRQHGPGTSCMGVCHARTIE